ncbi:hypothetical protein RFI_29867, partial [Reticulomyxa filosa]
QSFFLINQIFETLGKKIKISKILIFYCFLQIFWKKDWPIVTSWLKTEEAQQWIIEDKEMVDIEEISIELEKMGSNADIKQLKVFLNICVLISCLGEIGTTKVLILSGIQFSFLCCLSWTELCSLCTSFYMYIFVLFFFLYTFIDQNIFFK